MATRLDGDAGDGNGGASQEEQWKFTQWFRKMQPQGTRQEEGEDHDHLTAVEFDDTGRFLATGDKSGNIVILESDKAKSKHHVHYSFFGEFTSHFPDFDFVRSQAIDEKINQIKFGRQTNDAILLLTTNDKQIKLWKVQEKEQYKLVNWNIDPSPMDFNPNYGTANFGGLSTMRAQPIVKTLKVPRKIVTEKAKMPHLRKSYATDVHGFNITSLSCSADKESFISGDNLRINLWDMNISNQSYNVLDIKPDNMDELSEIISSIDYHPVQSNMFLYSTSLGNIMICDLRQRALVDYPSKMFSQSVDMDRQPAPNPEDENDQQTFFDEMTQNVTAAKFSKGGKFIISRDYMSVKIWDAAMEKKPVETIYIHEYLRERMWDLYSGDLLWDPFGIGISSTGDIVTGSYSNYFHILDLREKKDVFIQAAHGTSKIVDLHRLNKKKNAVYAQGPDGNQNQGQDLTKKKSKMNFNLFGRKKKQKAEAIQSKSSDSYPHSIPFDSIEFTKKILDCAWHPESNAVAIAGQNNLYVYSKTLAR